MKKVYGDDCMSRTQVYTWFIRFKNGRDDLNDDPRPGRPEASNRATQVLKNIPKTEFKKSMDKLVDRSKCCIELEKFRNRLRIFSA